MICLPPYSTIPIHVGYFVTIKGLACHAIAYKVCVEVIGRHKNLYSGSWQNYIDILEK